jgi:hypothetical protein
MKAPTYTDRARFLAALNEMDCGPLAYKLMNPESGDGVSLAEATHLVEKYRRFLLLNYLYPHLPIVPSRSIDALWHVHILDTAKYREDCQNLFGQFVDHWPYFGMKDATERAALESAFEETQRLWRQEFGEEMGR